MPRYDIKMVLGLTVTWSTVRLRHVVIWGQTDTSPWPLWPLFSSRSVITLTRKDWATLAATLQKRTARTHSFWGWIQLLRYHLRWTPQRGQIPISHWTRCTFFSPLTVQQIHFFFCFYPQWSTGQRQRSARTCNGWITMHWKYTQLKPDSNSNPWILPSSINSDSPLNITEIKINPSKRMLYSVF